MLLFQRICIAKQSDEEFKEYFKYELAPYPMSLFYEGTMRKTTKSTLFEIFEAEEIDLQVDECVFIIDGGMLLHRVLWHQNYSFQSVVQSYVAYVNKHFGSDVIVVFDGYNENCNSTKALERQRRSYKNICNEIFFDLNMNIPTTQQKFLSNLKNKKRLIEYLKVAFEEKNVVVKQAEDDADILIVRTCLEQVHKISVIVSDDIDVLVLFTALSSGSTTHYFMKLHKGKQHKKFFLPKVKKNIPFAEKTF